MRRSVRTWYWVALALAAPAALSAAMFSVTDLGRLIDLTNRTDSGSLFINNHAQVAGASVVNGSYRARLYDHGAWTNLGTLGGNESFASGINDAGRVGGSAKTAGGAKHAFLWTPGGTNGVLSNRQMRDLGTLGGTDSEAYSVNSSE